MNGIRKLADALRLGEVPKWLLTVSARDRQTIGDDMLGAIGAMEIVDAIDDEMRGLAEQLAPLEPGQFRSSARAWEILSQQMIDDGDTVDKVREVLVAFGALEDSDRDTNIVTLLEILLPPTK